MVHSLLLVGRLTLRETVFGQVGPSDCQESLAGPCSIPTLFQAKRILPIWRERSSTQVLRPTYGLQIQLWLSSHLTLATLTRLTPLRKRNSELSDLPSVSSYYAFKDGLHLIKNTMQGIRLSLVGSRFLVLGLQPSNSPIHSWTWQRQKEMDQIRKIEVGSVSHWIEVIEVSHWIEVIEWSVGLQSMSFLSAALVPLVLGLPIFLYDFLFSKSRRCMLRIVRWWYRIVSIKGLFVDRSDLFIQLERKSEKKKNAQNKLPCCSLVNNQQTITLSSEPLLKEGRTLFLFLSGGNPFSLNRNMLNNFRRIFWFDEKSMNENESDTSLLTPSQSTTPIDDYCLQSSGTQGSSNGIYEDHPGLNPSSERKVELQSDIHDKLTELMPYKSSRYGCERSFT